MHETYVVFDSRDMSKSSYNLSIRTTPRMVKSFQIISAQLPVIPNTKYIGMKIKHLENTLSLNDALNDDLFSIFYFRQCDTDHTYKTFKTDNIYPNMITFHKPLQSLANLQIEWYDNLQNKVYFTKPRLQSQSSVIFHIGSILYYGCVLSTHLSNNVHYSIQEYHNNATFTIPESDIIQFNTNDKVFAYMSGKFYVAIVFETSPYTLFIPSKNEYVTYTSIQV